MKSVTSLFRVRKSANRKKRTVSGTSAATVISRRSKEDNLKRKIKKKSGKSRKKSVISKNEEEEVQVAAKLATAKKQTALDRSRTLDNDENQNSEVESLGSFHEGTEVGDSITQKSSFPNLKHEKSWLLPTNQTGRELSFVLRPVDLAFLWTPNSQFLLKFNGCVDSDHVKEGLQKTINEFPIIAGRLKVKKAVYKFTQEDHEEFRVLGHDKDQRNKMEAEEQKSLPHKLYSVIKFTEKPKPKSGGGVLFEVVHLTDEQFEKQSSKHFFADRQSRHPNKEPHLKIRLTVTPSASILGVEFVTIIADLSSIGHFMDTWSKFCAGQKLNPLEKPILDRDLKMSLGQYFSISGDSGEKSKSVASGTLDLMKFLWVNSSFTGTPASFSFYVKKEILESFKKEISEKLQNEQDDEDSGEEEFEEFIKDNMVPLLSSDEILTAIAIYVWRKLKNITTEKFTGIFSVNKRGRVTSAPYRYFGNAYAYPEFTIETPNREDFHSVIGDYIEAVHVARGLACNDRSALDDLEMRYESLFSKGNPLNKHFAKNLSFDVSHQKPYLDFFKKNTPVFVSTLDLETEFTDIDFGHPECFGSFDFLLSNLKVSSNVVTFSKKCQGVYQVQFVLNKKLQECFRKVIQEIDILQLNP